MASVSAAGIEFSQASVGGLWSWTVRAKNVPNLGQLYEVSEVRTPFGKLTDVAVPLPGDVVLAMAESLSGLQAQLAPVVVLSSRTPNSVARTVTQGDPSTFAATLEYSNGGAFGSFLSLSATPDVPWLSVSPSSSAGVGQGSGGAVSVNVLPALLQANTSPYVGHVLLQNSTNPANSVSVAFSVTVLPQPIIQLSATTVNLSYSLSGGVGGAQQVVVTNGGTAGSQLSFTVGKVQNISPWLAITPGSAGPLASGASSPITLSLLSASLPTYPGTFTETVVVSSPNASNGPQTFLASLTVTP